MPNIRGESTTTDSTASAVEFLRTAPYAPADLGRIAHGNAERILHL